MAALLPVDEAIRRVLRHARARRTGRVPLDRALGLFLAEPVRADRDQPPFDRATVDGYAVRCDDPAIGRRALRVVETVFAGRSARTIVRPGTAALVMTGAPVPPGADAVIMREEAALPGRGGAVEFRKRPRKGDGFVHRGVELERGEVALEKGTEVTPRVVAVLAALGVRRPKVHLPPRVAVGATGDELDGRTASSIRNSNGPTVEALVREAGGAPVPLGIAGDREASILAMVRRGLRGADVLVLTGGVSAGDHDLVPAVLARAGVRRVFHRIDLKPGKPAWFGVKGRTLVFGLPGNPVSTQVTFALLVAPALRALAGNDVPRPRPSRILLGGPAPREGARPFYRPATLHLDRKGRLRARLLRWHGSGDFAGFARAEALVLRGPRAPAARAGDPCEILFL